MVESWDCFTALGNWPEARRAWRGFGIEVDDGSGEVSMPPVMACVRLNPSSSGEVVWGQRLDPARIVVLSVPLPKSQRRFQDIILNDGASNGARTSNGREVPVFDELAIWKSSQYSTFQAELNVPNQQAETRLRQTCDEQSIGMEDWSTIRMICDQCSRGNPKPHDCKTTVPEGAKRFGFGAHGEEQIESILSEWTSAVPKASYKNLELALKADC